MREYLKFYIDGQWVDPVEPKTLGRRQPDHRAGLRQDRDRHGGRCRQGGQGGAQGVRHAGRRPAARSASTCCRRSSPNTRSAPAISPTRCTEEMGAPPSLAAGPQVNLGLGHLTTAIDVLKNYEFEEQHGSDAGGQGADRRVRADHAVELADQPDRRQGVPGAGDRLHDGAQAVGGGAVLRADLHRDHRRRRRSRGRVQPGLRRRPRRRRRAVQPSRHRHGVLHRIHPRRRRRRAQRRRRRSSG